MLIAFDSMQEFDIILSLILKCTSLISFLIYLLLNYPRIEVRITRIKVNFKNKKHADKKE